MLNPALQGAPLGHCFPPHWVPYTIPWVVARWRLPSGTSQLQRIQKSASLHPGQSALERPACLGRLPGSLQAKGPEVQGPGPSGESWVSLSSLTLIGQTLYSSFSLSSPTVK